MESIYHYGINGQKRGVRNGPPYPLSASDHSISEKKAGWRKSLESANSNQVKNTPSNGSMKYHRNILTDEQKKK